MSLPRLLQKSEIEAEYYIEIDVPPACHPVSNLVSSIMKSWLCLAYHRIDKFDTVVFSRIVASRDHHTDGCIALFGTKTSDHANSKHDMVKSICSVMLSVSTFLLLSL